MVKIGKVRIMELLEPEFFDTILNHNISVIENGPCGGLMIVDTGLPGYLDQIESYLKTWGYSLEDISDIVITHWHHDHAGNAMTIKRISDAKIYAHVDELENLENPPKYNIIYSDELGVSFSIFKKTMERINNLHYESVKVDVALKGGEELGGFKVIHVPGHTKGHIALFDGKYLIVGDAIRNVRNTLSPPLRIFSWNYDFAVNSFNYLVSLPYTVLIPYHGDITIKNL
ncbi:MBL fold metallo-hydrolase [Saccharolobus islandicus]|uniref:Zn-dependent hydrolase, including glyoxylase n=6 Tax=Saccharolobus islandicus TaxID=43080 RepID=M9U4V3_SACIS|nr:MBL fold metallo-hydrolase [Sulfolobus islandicus]ACP37387.1 beta-lactamase domain protein [Sulfolobus islandicus M.14.25]ACP54539.1 beta-lactamase domain protein [Sulfolobus islandicus M.16.27]ACR41198.1 beta-lactamase domain protein [Sulfolobus islandicus M.16.4]ADX82165.1 beta-lactamase domain protein [Sulfolobus islandicus HVE10/4]ADX84628.1 beta-lactamase domain protein [Sulfolobus islandicus REY15A]